MIVYHKIKDYTESGAIKQILDRLLEHGEDDNVHVWVVFLDLGSIQRYRLVKLIRYENEKYIFEGVDINKIYEVRLEWLIEIDILIYQE